MTQVWFGSDLHFGHKNIQRFRGEFISSEQENRERIKADWNKVVGKNDTVYILGDACFTMDTINEFGHLPGRKVLIRGNHDLLDTQVYLKYFDHVYGLLKYKEFWLSHAPIHPDELRGKVNLHGHVHYASIKNVAGNLDSRYINMCCENLWKVFGCSLISIDQLRAYLKE